MLANMREVLSGPGDAFDADGATHVIDRAPVTYAPRSNTRPNFELLPPLEEMAGMALAYREQVRTLRDLQLVALGALLPTLYLALALAVLFTAIHSWVPFGILLGIAAVVGGALLVHATFSIGRKDFELGRVLLPLALVPLVMVGVVFAGALGERLVASAALAAITWASFARFGAAPIDFYAAWLRAHPRLRPATRQTLAEAWRPVRPDMALLTQALAVAVLVPAVSPAAAFVFLGVLSFRTLRTTPRPRTRLFRDIFPLYFTQGWASSNAPGIWVSDAPRPQRVATIYALAIPFFLTLAFALCFFFPWDVLRSAIDDQYHSGYLDQVYARLRSEPWAWMLFIKDRLVDRSPAATLPLLLAFPVAFLFSLAIPGTLALALYQPALRRLDALADEIAGLDADEDTGDGPRPRTEWQWYVDRLRDSSHVAADRLSGHPLREADHLFLGVEPHHKFPILLHQDILREHCYIVGDSGGGKTSMGILSPVLQLLRPYRSADHVAAGDTLDTPPPPLLLIDLKGDPVLFHTLREETLRRRWTERDTSGRLVERHGKFLFFTLEKGFASDRFNPFSSVDPERRTLSQLCQLVLDSLDLNHGPGYGRGYFTARSRQALQLTLTHLTEQRLPITFVNIERALTATGSKIIPDAHARREAFHLVAIIRALLEYEQLTTTPAIERDDPDHVIHMPRVFEERQVVYFWLPAMQESISVREVGQLALHAFVTAAIDRQRSGSPVRQSYAVIDEFQSIVSRGFKPILQQARQLGVGMILANQSQADLDTPDGDLRPTIRSTTRLRLHFAVTDPREVQDLIATSGEEVAFMRSSGPVPGAPDGSGGDGPILETIHPTIKPRFTRNDIAATSDHPHDFIAYVTRGLGYTQYGGLPFSVRSTWPTSLADARRREAAPWPTAMGAQVAGTQAPAHVDEGTRAEAGRLAALESAQQAELARALAEEATRPAPAAGPPKPRTGPRRPPKASP